MSDKSVDDLIRDALAAENEQLGREMNEPGYFRQARGLFRGPLGWVMWLVYLWQIAAMIGGIYCLVLLFGTTDPLAAIRWATLAILLMMFILSGKSFMGSHFEANRVLREVKRIELRLALLGTEAPADRKNAIGTGTE